jgi:hypothetical protein
MAEKTGKIRMKTYSSGPFICPFLLALFVGIFVLASLQYRREVALVPLVIGIPTLVLLFTLMIDVFHRARKRPREFDLDNMEDTQDTNATSTPWWPVVRIMAWILVFYGMVFFFGFLAIFPWFITAFLIAEGKRRWYTSLVLSLLTTLALYLGVSVLFEVDLWAGAIPEVIPGILGGSIIPPL